VVSRLVLALPRDLAAQRYQELRERYRDRPDVTVIVDQEPFGDDDGLAGVPVRPPRRPPPLARPERLKPPAPIEPLEDARGLLR